MQRAIKSWQGDGRGGLDDDEIDEIVRELTEGGKVNPKFLYVYIYYKK